MAIRYQRLCYKYMKVLVILAVIAFFVQLFIAVYLFPSENINLVRIPKDHNSRDRGDISARKLVSAFSDDEDLHSNVNINKNSQLLRVEELDFKPVCEIHSREAISAIHRAKSQNCKQQIVNKTCLIQNGDFYPKMLPHSCPNHGLQYKKYLGCYQDEKKLRLLSAFYGNFVKTNSPVSCLDICVQAGLPYAGVQYASECFCGDKVPPLTSKMEEEACDMNCPGDTTKLCGGYFTMNVYETGIAKFEPQSPKTTNNKESARIIFLLSLNGRALRQVYRLINVLYRNTHYFYIHVDSRQNYLHRELSVLEKQFPNIKMATMRYSTIWGGASLLQMLLSAMEEFVAADWEWDYMINLSESDFPIKSLKKLETFLGMNKGLNFVKSHGREVQRFIKKQGLDKTFIECDSHMWRVGDRRLPRGIVVDGGSDWLALSPAFVTHLVRRREPLLAGLGAVFRHTLLPAESYFHTVLRNTEFCDTYVDNNLHVTNWKRKLGCKCQYKHVVDWCGCSPNDFRSDDWPRIQSTSERPLFFARKFEPIINQEIITRVEKSIGADDHRSLYNLDGYWQNVYHAADLPAPADDLRLTHARSLVRLATWHLAQADCTVIAGNVLEINSYSRDDVYKGDLILYRGVLNGAPAYVETWYKPKGRVEFHERGERSYEVKSFKVGSDYDQKERTFRNLANVLGPLSEPVLYYDFSGAVDGLDNLTIVWADPTGDVAHVDRAGVRENNSTNFVTPTLKPPLLPGVWKVGMFKAGDLIVETSFLITPLETLSGSALGAREAAMLHSGMREAGGRRAGPGGWPGAQASAVRVASTNAGRLGADLREWIDSLTRQFYTLLSSCVRVTGSSDSSFVCGQQTLSICSSSEWSSLSPDPKGHIGKLNEKTGMLERV